MLYSEIIAVCSEIHTKHINTVCGKNVEFVNVKHGGTYSNHWDLKGSRAFISYYSSKEEFSIQSALEKNHYMEDVTSKVI
jgi:hypothetical protein